MADIVSQADTVLIPSLGFSYLFVDTEPKLISMLADFANSSIINVDFEGVELCRLGQVCLGQFHASQSRRVYIVDFVTMNPFEVADKRLKTLMESETILKVFFDPRNDADALVHLYGVHSRNALCLQVAEVAFRQSKNHQVRFLCGLAKVMDRHVRLPINQKKALMDIKNAGRAHFRSDTNDMFLKRPMDAFALEYAAADVFYFDQLRIKLYESLGTLYKSRVREISQERLRACLEPGYQAHGRHKSIAPSLAI